MNPKDAILRGETALGIEFGSTRIKGVLIDYDGNVLATGAYEWENSLIDGIWTYALSDAEKGLQACYSDLRQEVEEKYGIRPETFGAIGVSAMMHGYIALDKEDRQVAPFQTWRNTNTTPAADALTEALDFNIPLRWSAAHLYQRMLDKEAHVSQVASVFTLAAYMHYRLTGEKVIGIGDAAGMFPIDSDKGDYNEAMVQIFDRMAAEAGFPLHLRDVFPKVLSAGDAAGVLTKEGAALLDETGAVKPGIPLCPPEGDAGTGMTATNSVAPRTGNLSAGTSGIISAVVNTHGPHSKVASLRVIKNESAHSGGRFHHAGFRQSSPSAGRSIQQREDGTLFHMVRLTGISTGRTNHFRILHRPHLLHHSLRAFSKRLRQHIGNSGN